MHFSLIAINCRYTHSCLSLFYVRNTLTDHFQDCSAVIHDFTINDPYYDTLLSISGMKTDALFFSAYIWNADFILRLVNDLSIINPAMPMIIGGPQVSALQYINLPQQCILITGEVEGLEESFFIDLKKRRLKNSYTASKMNPFHFPYTAKDLAEALSDRSIYYESSRGCPFSCSYCLSSTDNNMVNKDFEIVKDELATLLKNQPKIIRFVDRTFNASSKRALELWQFLAEQKVDTTFHFEIAPDLFTEEMFAFLEKVRPHLFQFEIGIQSTHRLTLEAINRRMDINASLNNIKRLMALDTIHLHVDLILGLPYETIESFRHSFNDIFSLLPHYIQMGLLKILPHTPISEKNQEFGMAYCIHPPYQILSTKWLPHEQITKLYWFGECVESFYNNRFFRSFFRYVRKRTDGYTFFSELLEICLHKGFFQRARTQKFMCSILEEMVFDWKDKKIVLEILKYDWLRTGNRFLPDSLKNEPLKKEKDRLWKDLPQDYPPYYSRQTRNSFFKQSLFATFSRKALKEIGLIEGNKTTVCFRNERECNVLHLQKTFLIC